MAPGIILSITFFMATGLTTLSFVIERKEGLLERSIVSGIFSVQIKQIVYYKVFYFRGVKYSRISQLG